MRDDGEAGPCKASEEVRRHIRIKLKDSFRVNSPQSIGQAEEVPYPTRLFGHEYELPLIENHMHVWPERNRVANIVNHVVTRKFQILVIMPHGFIFD